MPAGNTPRSPGGQVIASYRDETKDLKPIIMQHFIFSQAFGCTDRRTAMFKVKPGEFSLVKMGKTRTSRVSLDLERN